MQLVRRWSVILHRLYHSLMPYISITCLVLEDS